MASYFIVCGVTGALTLIVTIVCMRRYYQEALERARYHYQNLFHETEMHRCLFMAAFHAGAEGRVAISPAGKVLAVNRAIGDLFNFAEKDYLKKTAEELWQAIAAGCANRDEAIQVLTGLAYNGRRAELRTRTGKLVRVRGAPVRNVMRQEIAELTVFQDLTEDLGAR